MDPVGYALARAIPPDPAYNKSLNALKALLLRDPDEVNRAGLSALANKIPSGSAGTAEEWTTRASYPTGFYRGTAVAVGGKLHVIGGGTDSTLATITGAHRAYDPATNTWENKASLPTGRRDLRAVVLDGKIHVLGGRTAANTVVNSHDVYDPATDTWSTKANLTLTRAQGMAVVFEGKIHYIGGNANLTTHYRWDPGTNTWSTLTALATGRQQAGICVHDNKIFMTGGSTSVGTSRTTVLEYSTAGGWVTRGETIPLGREDHLMVSYGGRLWIVGGQAPAASGGTYKDFYSWAAGEPSWTTEVASPNDHWFVTGAVVGDALHAVGHSSTVATSYLHDAYSFGTPPSELPHAPALRRLRSYLAGS